MTFERILDHGNYSSSQLAKNLNTAASEGNEEEVAKLIKSGSSLHSFGIIGFTPLHLASKNGHEETCKILLQFGCDVDGKNKVGKTPLHLASTNGHTEVVRLLLSCNANADMIDILGMTPLHWACERGHDAIVRILLDNGADCNIKNKYKKSPLQLALEKHHDNIVAMLNPEENSMECQLSSTSEVCSLNDVEMCSPRKDLEPESQYPSSFPSSKTLDTSKITNSYLCEIQKVVEDDSSRCNNDVENTEMGIDEASCLGHKECTDEDESPKGSFFRYLTKKRYSSVNLSEEDDVSIEEITDGVSRNSLNVSVDLEDEQIDKENQSQDRLLNTLNELENIVSEGGSSKNFDAFWSNSAAELLKAQAALVPLEDPSRMLRRAINYGRTIQLTAAGQMALDMLKPDPIIIPREEEIEEVVLDSDEESSPSYPCNAVMLRSPNAATNLLDDSWNAGASYGPPTKRNKT